MTRQEFIDTVDDIDELLDFCSDIGYELEGVYGEEERDDYINNQVHDMVREYNWEEIRDLLDGIPTGYYFYYMDRWGDWNGRDSDDIDDLKQEVLEYADENELFDPEDEEEEHPEDETEEEDVDDFDEVDDEPVELGCDMNDFLTSGNDVMQAIRDRADAERREYELAMQKFLNTKMKINIPN